MEIKWKEVNHLLALILISKNKIILRNKQVVKKEIQLKRVKRNLMKI
jgi:hypothetical protein